MATEAAPVPVSEEQAEEAQEAAEDINMLHELSEMNENLNTGKIGPAWEHFSSFWKVYWLV